MYSVTIPIVPYAILEVLSAIGAATLAWYACVVIDAVVQWVRKHHKGFK